MSKISKKSWEEFQNTGLILFINQILHIFGWSIVLEKEDEKIINVYPARVKFRGFNEASVDKAYKKISEYMVNHSKEIYNEIKNE